MNAQPISWFRADGERPVGGNTLWTKPVNDEPDFRISSACCSGNCVAVAILANGSVLVRHHRSGDGGPTLEFSAAEWDAFIAGVRRGEFDVPGAPAHIEGAST